MLTDSALLRGTLFLRHFGLPTVSCVKGQPSHLCDSPRKSAKFIASHSRAGA
jgi:hypothetical protein